MRWKRFVRDIFHNNRRGGGESNELTGPKTTRKKDENNFWKLEISFGDQRQLITDSRALNHFSIAMSFSHCAVPLQKRPVYHVWHLSALTSADVRASLLPVLSRYCLATRI